MLARLYASMPPAAGWVLGGLAVHRLLRRPDAEAGPFLLLAAGFFVAVAGGLADVTALGRSQVSTALPVALARATVAASLGLGAGMVIVALLRVARDDGHPRVRGSPTVSLDGELPSNPWGSV